MYKSIFLFSVSNSRTSALKYLPGARIRYYVYSELYVRVCLYIVNWILCFQQEANTSKQDQSTTSEIYTYSLNNNSSEKIQYPN